MPLLRQNRIYNKITILKNTIMTTSHRAEKALDDLKVNPYFEKYAEKIAKLQQTSPEEFLQRIDNQVSKKEEKSKDLERQYTQLLNPKQGKEKQRDVDKESLDKYMKVELLKDKSTEEISEIWKQYHLQKDSTIAATIPKSDFVEMKRKLELYPTFLFPMPRTQGYEFIMCQSQENTIHFTPLLCFQVHKENAPECLTIKHYLEFMDDKNIVLMKGEYDKNVINSKEALYLANQVQLYYCQNYDSKNKLLETFTKKPDEFKHMDLIQEIENLAL